MSFLDSRKPWCTQRLCQLSLTQLTQVLRGLEQYGFPTAGEIENSAYQQADREELYVNLVAKAIYCILELKKNLHTIDKEALMKAFDELRYGKKQETRDVLHFDRSGYTDGLYFDRSKYADKAGKQVLKHVEVVANRATRVSFELDQDPVPKKEDDVGSTASSSSASHENELAQLDNAISHIKSNNFNAQALIEKLRSKYNNDAKLSHKVKMKVHCLLELLEDFDCYDDLIERAAD